MVASSSVPLSKKSQQSFMQYYSSVQELQNLSRIDARSRYLEIDKLYQREKDLSTEQLRAKAANASGDPSRYQNMTIPVVMPQVEAAVTYQTSVFLTGSPIFGVVANPAYMDAAMQMETVLENNATKGAWPRELLMFFRDGFKYNFAPVEVSWESQTTYSVETNMQEDIKDGTPKETIWSGNVLKRLDPYNTFVDPRVAPTEVHTKGEHAGYTKLITRIELKQFLANLPDKIIGNVTAAFESSTESTGSSNAESMSYYRPQVNPAVNKDNYEGGGMNWMSWAEMSTTRNQNIEYKDMYELTTLYCKILPSEYSLNVPSKNTPQIYKLYIVNHEVIVYCELQTNAHSNIPIFIGQPHEDGLEYQTKSLATNGAPFQELSTAYMTSIIASKRRAISDRTLYDPSRITSAAINSDNPSAKIPVRPKAYGSKISDAVYQFPYREDQASNSMQQIQTILGLANSLSGQNQASQGQFVKGNKTLHEFESTMQNANGRDQMVSILLEYQVFVPMKEVLKLNILQFQGGTTLYNKDAKKAIEVDPVALRKAVLEFKVTDGLLPADKLIGADALRVTLEALSNNPNLGAGYNLGPLFSYLMKTQGADLAAFEKSPAQIEYESAMQSWNGLAQLTIEKGGDPASLPPQPKPEEYGYNPEQRQPSAEEANAQQEQTILESITQPPQQAQ